MEQCKNCIFFDKEYDELRQEYNDVVYAQQEIKEKHFCRLYWDITQGGVIPQEVWENKVKCKYFVSKDK